MLGLQDMGDRSFMYSKNNYKKERVENGRCRYIVREYDRVMDQIRARKTG